jgi:hypothetical protein
MLFYKKSYEMAANATTAITGSSISEVPLMVSSFSANNHKMPVMLPELTTSSID